ncbi:uncharacterized protein LOC119402619 [Rhipicephalus sanguineus]|uniref:uncharacterized protein LOC119402619 n=1 Tax=Rhipicephalus sanguineus TaxID=34632 RepID=UPI0020C493A4|nr:uncharacterized protein LOC119402619 [Rhipicephalus sanguineus]
MMRHFKPYSWILVVSGLTVFHKLQANDNHKTKTMWKFFCLAYSLVCFTIFMFVGVLFVLQFIILFFIKVQVFTIWLHVVSFSVINFKVVHNALCIAFNSGNLSRFFDESARYEAAVNFVPPNCCRQPAGRYVQRFVQLIVFLGSLSISTYLACIFIDYNVSDVAVGALLKVTCLAGTFLFYVYQMSDFIVLRPCLEVLLWYIRQQHEVLLCLTKGGCSGLLFVKRDKKVEEIRLSLCAILLLKNRLNGIWRWSVMISGSVVLLLACISIYTAYVEGFSTVQTFLGLLYCVLSLLDLLDVAGLSQEMVNEIRSMRQTLESTPARFESGPYFAEISYLRDTIKPNQMAISGAGFFYLNLPLIVSLPGSVITYTVILVQTSESMAPTTK